MLFMLNEVCTDLWGSLVCPGHANRPLSIHLIHTSDEETLA